MRIAPPVELNVDQRSRLEAIVGSRMLPARLIERSRIVLLAAVGCRNKQIAAELNITPEKAARWRKRYLQHGLAGLEKDAPRRGRKPSISAKLVRELIRKTTQQTPPNATHWSTRSMAAAMGISAASVRRIWQAHGLKPHRTASFKLSNDPRFVEKLEDVVGLYLNPPEHALVLSVDEKSRIQALDRTQPGLALKKGRAGTRTHDYKRYGTTTLFAALNTLDGKVISRCMKNHRHHEWLPFLRLMDRQTAPHKQLHLIVDNYATHKHEKVQRWLARHKRFHIHFTPTNSSWLNMVERFFRNLSEKRLRRGTFRSVDELVGAIDAYIDQHNNNPKPYIWTAAASDILQKVKPARRTLDKRQSA